MFTVKLVARPDARMVEVPLEIEVELPREFDGAALLASSGLPRRVRLKATKDALRLSTAYRADQLVGDIVKSALRGTAQDVERVQEAVAKFIRTVRERRQDGATLFVAANGKGKIDVVEQMPSARPPPPPPPPPPVMQTVRISPAERSTTLERRLLELEAMVGERISALEQKLTAIEAHVSRMEVAGQVAGPGMERGAARAQAPRSSPAARRATAVEAYAEGLRAELAARAAAASARARTDVERCDRAAALVADAELLGVPADGTSQRMREASAQAAARQTALERLAQEIEFYTGPDLPVAAQLLGRLEDTGVPDPAPSLEPVAQAFSRAAQGADGEPRAAWMQRAAALCAWQLIEPKRGDALDAASHQAVDSGGPAVSALACPGARRADGSAIAPARVLTIPAAAHATGGSDSAPAASPAAAGPPGPSPAASPAPGNSTVAPAQTPTPDSSASTAKPAAAADAASPAAPFTGPGETAILPEEAAAAAAAASRVPKLIVSEDPAAKDEALAVEMALSALKPVSNLPVQGSGANLEEVHPLVDPLPDDAKPNE